MGDVARVFQWQQLFWDEEVGVWLHGYGEEEYVNYSITCRLRSNVPPAAVDVKAQMTLGVTGPHPPDGTIGRTVWVKNNSVGPQPFISVKLHRFRQS
ncbi:hypothetical protein [Streptomyces nitrosporeus]|uniref:Uncharacterized protein n=1 Tax=Streptomyces nitrosporeus TaxID=28894 RepID=A0A5J6F4S6_9ACTN|nr:hypothetical protein [Streptomyces nitrosporeus]QEU71122.1 hypothetical protein CP967_03350 [Streptomyces nitrosporeus]GGZ15286.1 hypothetical protein GCM10010327_52880 [Streptomyces nitrosporeus]